MTGLLNSESHLRNWFWQEGCKNLTILPLTLPLISPNTYHPRLSELQSSRTICASDSFTHLSLHWHWGLTASSSSHLPESVLLLFSHLIFILKALINQTLPQGGIFWSPRMHLTPPCYTVLLPSPLLLLLVFNVPLPPDCKLHET
jgi:hypothetical protein